MSSERIKSWPTKEGPRERLLAEGPERMTDSKVPEPNGTDFPPGNGYLWGYF
jgi:hypothetical protein